MTRHLISLIWHRKRHNVLLAAEIFFSFLVLFGVAFTGLFYANNWRQPLGFDIDRVWSINAISSARFSPLAVGRRDPRFRAAHQ
jgi:putative ABC transport system permease protein